MNTVAPASALAAVSKTLCYHARNANSLTVANLKV